MCCLVLLSLYFLARPKSIINNLLQWRPIPIRKLSGLMSLWMKFLLWTYSTLPIHLVSQHEDCLHGKSPRAEVEEILEARAKQVHHQHVVVALHTIPPNMRDPHTSLITRDNQFLYRISPHPQNVNVNIQMYVPP